jgi:hypothetical protein
MTKSQENPKNQHQDIFVWNLGVGSFLVVLIVFGFGSIKNQKKLNVMFLWQKYY